MSHLSQGGKCDRLSDNTFFFATFYWDAINAKILLPQTPLPIGVAMRLSDGQGDVSRSEMVWLLRKRTDLCHASPPSVCCLECRHWSNTWTAISCPNMKARLRESHMSAPTSSSQSQQLPTSNCTATWGKMSPQERKLIGTYNYV